jgi:hypothetical protein
VSRLIVTLAARACQLASSAESTDRSASTVGCVVSGVQLKRAAHKSSEATNRWRPWVISMRLSFLFAVNL